MRKIFKKVLKIFSVIIGVIIIMLIVLFYRFSTPKSDKKIRSEFSKSNSEVFIEQAQFKNFKYRIIKTQKKIDTTLPTIVFIHGSIGSVLDFKRYLVDNELNIKANLIAYDRVGYGVYQTGNVQESISFEAEMLEDLLDKFKIKNVLLVGYSYGGTIALASQKKYIKIILLAPAVYSKVEPMPWGLNLYKWKATRWLVPKIWQAASKEKLSHKADLLNYELHWNKNLNTIISVHGNQDWIVPIENSIFLERNFSSKQFELLTLEGAGHGFVWSHFKEIKNILLQQLN